MTRDAFDMFDRPDERARFGDNERGRGPRVELTLQLHRDNPLSITVSDPESRGRWINLPKSEITYRDLGRAVVEVEMPEWLAIKEELV